MKVEAPDGRTWRVGRRWVPWEVRWRALRNRDREGQQADGGSGGDGGAGEGGAGEGGGGWGFSPLDIADELGAVLAVIGLVVLGILAIVTVLPLIILLAELVVVLLILGPLLFARIVLRRPWTVAARTHGPPAQRVERQAVGWRASGRTEGELAEAVRSGAVAAPSGAQDERAT